jgi:hypothetical protein
MSGSEQVIVRARMDCHPVRAKALGWTFMRTFKRVHHTGTEAVVTQHADGWRMQVNLREPGLNPMTIAGYMATVERAKEVADKETAKYGHVCTEACKD